MNEKEINSHYGISGILNLILKFKLSKLKNFELPLNKAKNDGPELF